MEFCLKFRRQTSVLLTKIQKKLDKDLLVQPYEESSSNIMNKLYADDFYEKIFEHLPLRDLCATADVNMQNAQHAFRRRFADLKLIENGGHFEFMVVYKNVLCYDFLGSINVLASLFRNFGPFIKSINS